MEKKDCMSLLQDGKSGNFAGCVAEEHFGWLLLACHASRVLRSCEVLGLGWSLQLFCWVGPVHTTSHITVSIWWKGRGGEAAAEMLSDSFRTLIPAGAGRQGMGGPSACSSHEPQPPAARCWVWFWVGVQVPVQVQVWVQPLAARLVTTTNPSGGIARYQGSSRSVCPARVGLKSCILLVLMQLSRPVTFRAKNRWRALIKSH